MVEREVEEMVAEVGRRRRQVVMVAVEGGGGEGGGGEGGGGDGGGGEGGGEGGGRRWWG